MAIRTIKVSGGDFTTVKAWVASLPATLTEPEIGELYYNDQNETIISVPVTSAANYIELKAATSAAHAGQFSSQKAGISSGGTGPTLSVSVGHFRLTGIQLSNSYNIQGSPGANYGQALYINGAANGIYTIKDCIIRKIMERSNQSGCDGITVTLTNSGKTINLINNLIFGFANNVSINFNYDTLVAYNNTLISAKSYGMQLGGDRNSTAHVKNNISIDSGIADFYETGEIGTTDYGYNLSSDSSALDSQKGIKGERGGSTSVTQAHPSFLEKLGEKFLLSLGDSVARGFGTDLTSDASYPFNTDFVGGSRGSIWDIGCSQATLLPYCYDFKIQRGWVPFGASADYVDIPISAVVQANSFARITGGNFVESGRIAGGQTNEYAVSLGANVAFTSTTNLRISRSSSGENYDHRFDWELWEYTGLAGGPNEFITRFNDSVTCAIGESTHDIDLFAYGNPVVGKCVPIILGLTEPGTSATWDRCSVKIQMLDVAGHTTARITRSIPGFSALVLSLAVVEFTGSNWTVYGNISHTFATAGVAEFETISDVVSWANCFIISYMLEPSSYNNISEIGHLCYPGSLTTRLNFYLSANHRAPASTSAMAYVIKNSAMTVYHTDSVAAGQTDLPLGSAVASPPIFISKDLALTSSLNSMSTVASMSYMASAGTGVLYPRGHWQYVLTGINQPTYWHQRQGQSAKFSVQIIDLSITSNLAVTLPQAAIISSAKTPGTNYTENNFISMNQATLNASLLTGLFDHPDNIFTQLPVQAILATQFSPESIHPDNWFTQLPILEVVLGLNSVGTEYFDNVFVSIPIEHLETGVFEQSFYIPEPVVDLPILELVLSSQILSVFIVGPIHNLSSTFTSPQLYIDVNPEYGDMLLSADTRRFIEDPSL